MWQELLQYLASVASTLGAAVATGLVSISATVLPYTGAPVVQPPAGGGGTPPPVSTPRSGGGGGGGGSTSNTISASSVMTLQNARPGNWVNTVFPTVLLKFPNTTLNNRLSHDTNPNGQPTKDRIGTLSSRTFILPFSSKANYVHAQFQTSRGWSRVYTLQVNVDTDNPTVSIQNVSITKGKATVTVRTSDRTSSITHTYVSIDSSSEKEIQKSTYTTAALASGKHSIKVRTVDAAGNQNTATQTITVSASGAFSPSRTSRIKTAVNTKVKKIVATVFKKK